MTVASVFVCAVVIEWGFVEAWVRVFLFGDGLSGFGLWWFCVVACIGCRVGVGGCVGGVWFG